MSGFSGAWLALREPVDARSRSAALVDLLVDHVRTTRAGAVNVVDFGTGHGSNPRFVMPRLAASGATQDWLLVDHAAALLDELPARMRVQPAVTALEAGGVLRFATRCVDLSHELPALAQAHAPSTAGATGATPVLATAAALFDLVSLHWLQRFAIACAASRALVLVALSYDGRASLAPAHPHDAWMLEQFNLHQQGDKGFGAALGPHASRHAREVLAARGYRVHVARSDWQLADEDAALQTELLSGWAAAVRELQPGRLDHVDVWLTARHAHVMRGESRITIGHEDLFAVPA